MFVRNTDIYVDHIIFGLTNQDFCEEFGKMMASVGYHKKGYPKQEPKKLLRPCKYQSQSTTAGKPATSEARLDRLAHLEQISGLARSGLGPEPNRKASDEVLILRLARGPTP